MHSTVAAVGYRRSGSRTLARRIVEQQSEDCIPMKSPPHVLPLCCFLHVCRQRVHRSYRLRWNELESAIAGEQVRMVLPGGARIEGRALAVQPEALLIRITKTSDRKLQSKGEASVPRSAVSVLQLVKTGNRWRAVGTTVGSGIGCRGWYGDCHQNPRERREPVEVCGLWLGRPVGSRHRWLLHRQAGGPSRNHHSDCSIMLHGSILDENSQPLPWLGRDVQHLLHLLQCGI